MAKNLYDLTVENNDKINSQLYDETGMVTVPLYGAAAESAMSESEYLAATGGTSHTLYNLEAQKDLNAQVAGQRAQAGTLYELSKPTYGVKGKQLYDLGVNNSGYAKYLGDSNKKALKQNLYAIDEGEKAAKQEIAVNTAQLKAQNISNYAQYVSKYGTVLDDYERYESENYSPAQIQQKLLKDGYTADQIGAVDRLRAERDLIKEGEAPNRDNILSALQEGTVSQEWAEGQLLSSYTYKDAAKVAEDVKNGIITEETANAWAKTTLDTYAISGIRLPYADVDALVKDGVLDKATADAYKQETNAIRSELAQKAFDSPTDLNQFLKAWGGSDLVDQDGNPISDGAKSAYALQKVVDLVNTGVFESNGMGNADAIEEIFSAYTEKVKNASETDAETMLAAANAVYEDEKRKLYDRWSEDSDLHEGGVPYITPESEGKKLLNQMYQLETKDQRERELESLKRTVGSLKDAVGQMYVAANVKGTEDDFKASTKDGITALGNWAAGIVYENNDVIFDKDYSQAQKNAFEDFIKDKDISVEILQKVSRSGTQEKVIVINYNGKRQEVDGRFLTNEDIDALNEFGLVYDSQITYSLNGHGADTYDRTNRKTGVPEKTKTRRAGEEWK